MLRPPGLFDAAGAVAGAGMVATILGLVFCLEPIGFARRGISLAFAMAGMLALYLSHVRAAFVMTLGMMAAYLVMLAMQEQKKRALGFGVLGFGMVVVGLSVATMLGGTSISERFMTLLEGDPRDLYYQSRGIQVEAAMTDLVDEYPLGAGLGRWGMLSYLLRRHRWSNAADCLLKSSRTRGCWTAVFRSSRSTAWCCVVTLFGDLQLIRSLADPEDRLVATIVVAANVGTIGLVFTFVPFGTAVGMQFWLLEGMLRGAMADRPRIRIDVLADRRRRSHAAWRDGLGEPRARPPSGVARRGPSRHASRLARPRRAADSHGAPGMAAVQPACARQPAVVADRAGGLAAPARVGRARDRQRRELPDCGRQLGSLPACRQPSRRLDSRPARSHGARKWR